MKLRLFNHSLRLRLTPEEVQELSRHGRVGGRTPFAAGVALTYTLNTSPGVKEISAALSESAIHVIVPAQMAARWAESSEVGLSATQWAGDQKLTILIEKDFECLDAARNEPGLHLYPNPRKTAET